MKPRRTSTRARDDDRWRCHACGAQTGLRVIRTEHDEDRYKVRIRQCRCGEVMATEESPISLDQFYARCAASRTVREHRYQSKVTRRRSAVKTCRHCGGTYRMRKFSDHCQTPEHLASLRTKPTDRSRRLERERRRREYWRARGIDPDATVGQQLMDIRATDGVITRIEDIPA